MTSALQALKALEQAYHGPAAIAAQWHAQGGRAVHVLGVDAPYEMIDAAGLLPVRLVPDAAADLSRITGLVGSENIDLRGLRLLQAAISIPRSDALLITHADNAQPQVFAYLREMTRLGMIRPIEMHLLDLAILPKRASLDYNRLKLARLAEWLGSIGQPIDDAALRGAVAARNRQREVFAGLSGLRGARRLKGSDIVWIAGAGAILPVEQHISLMAQLDETLPLAEGRPAFLNAPLQESDALTEGLETQGWFITGEDHAWGADWFARPVAADGDILANIAARAIDPWGGPFAPAQARAERTARRAAETEAETILHLVQDDDETGQWDRYFLNRESDLPLEQISSAPAEDVPEQEQTIAAGRGERSRKSLSAVADFGSYQRKWFAGLRDRVAAGEPFAAVNANAPMEILRAFDIPYVVNQWWASIVGAKQQSVRYSALLRANHLPDNVEGYSSMGLAAAFDQEDDLKPWGGLPHPTLLQALTSSDATRKLFEAWADATGGTLQLFERTVETRLTIPTEWWNVLHDDWDTALESERLDLLADEFREAIDQIAAITGRTFDPERLVQVLELVNEQEDYFRKTRDLIARTYPAPVSAVDTLPATMVPQWQRGTEWGRDAAKRVFEEVSALVEQGHAAVPNERLRLMFVGRGMWSDMGFYQRWEESHGAVFVWTMYLGLAADGYIRRLGKGRDPLRALAARFATVGDEMRLPGWAGPWHVKEAKSHGVHGAVALSDADPLVVGALRDAGIPVLELGVDNYFRAPEDEAEIDRRMEDFLATLN